MTTHPHVESSTDKRITHNPSQPPTRVHIKTASPGEQKKGDSVVCALNCGWGHDDVSVCVL